MKYIVSPPTLTGLLTAVYESYYSIKDADAIVFAPAYTLIDSYTECAEDAVKAAKVRDAIINKGGRAFYHSIVDAFRSGNPDKHEIIASYLKLFFKVGTAVLSRHGDEAVVRFQDITRKIGRESERIRAFTRFSEMKNGIYYAHFTSDNDVLELVVPDLAARLNTLRFILHDVTRGKLCYYDGQKCHFTQAPEYVEIVLSDAELLFQDLWRDYHENVTIKERKNPRLQRGFLPKKYRTFMTEFTTAPRR